MENLILSDTFLFRKPSFIQQIFSPWPDYKQQFYFKTQLWATRLWIVSNTLFLVPKSIVLKKHSTVVQDSDRDNVEYSIMTLLHPHIWPKNRWVCPELHFIQKYQTINYEPAILGNVIKNRMASSFFRCCHNFSKSAVCIQKNDEQNKHLLPRCVEGVACCAWDGCKR